MKTQSRLVQGIVGSVLIIALLWCIKSAEILFSIQTISLGVKPLTAGGLIGIFTAPFIHGSLEHLFNNTLPLLILGSVLFYGYRKTWLRVLLFVWISSGVGVWILGRDAYHIGASGLTHGLFFYLFVVSIFRRDKSSIGIMMIAFLMYGGMTMSIFPREEAISFEYHFFGALAGLLAAIIWRNVDPKPIEKKYDWEMEQEPIDEDNYWESELDSDDTKSKHNLH